MAMTFAQLRAGVQQQIGDFSANTQTYVNRWLNDARNMIWEEIPGEYKQKTDYLATTEPYVSTSAITVEVTEDDETVTSDGSTNTAFTTAMAGRYMSLNGTDPWYKIASRTSATELELEDAYVGSSDTDCDFEIHTYLWPLPSDVGHLLQVSAELEASWVPLDILEPTDFYGAIPVPLRWSESTPEECWLDEKDSSGNYQLGLYPVPDSKTLIRVRYEKTLTEMSADSDTVGIPGADAAIKAHAIFEAYTWRQRTREAQLWLQRFYDARNRLAISSPRSKGATYRRRDHTNASTAGRNRPNLGAQFPR